jgi:hypothetical protein
VVKESMQNLKKKIYNSKGKIKMTKNERKMFDKLKKSKKLQKSTCYVCGNEISTVDHSDGASQIGATFGSDKTDKQFSIKATMLNKGEKEVATCKGCFVYFLVELTKTITQIHAVDPRNMN